MDARITELTNTFAWLERCCMYEKQWTPDDVEEVVLFAQNVSEWGTGGWENTDDEYGGGPEGSAMAIVKLKTGDYGLLESSEDYTGHGCQCGSYTGVYPTLESLLYTGVEEYSRDAIRGLLGL